MIDDGQIVDDDVSATAQIDPTKIAGTAWTGGNDGPGSGLDADLLDGQQAADFLSLANDAGRSGVAADLYEGALALSDKYVNQDDLDHLDAADGVPAQAVYVDADGRVGIGTTTPAEKLAVAGIVHSTAGGFKFPDGTTQITAAAGGAGDGHSLDADDGHPVDALYVDADGQVGIGTTSPARRLDVQGAIRCTDSLVVSSPPRDGIRIGQAVRNGVYLKSAGAPTGATYSAYPCGYQVAGAEGYGYYAGQVGRSGVRVYQAGSPSNSGSTGLYNGLEVRAAEGSGLMVGHADSAGVCINSTGNHGVVVVEPEKSGLYVSAPGQYGVFVDSSANDGILVQDTQTDGVQINYAHDCGVEILSPGYHGILIMGTDNDGIQVNNAGEDGGYFDLGPASTGWAVYANGWGLLGNGIYCHGNGLYTGSWAHTVKTSKGWEAVNNMSAPDAEIVASGTARLINGRCRVEFERLFSEAISHHIPMKVVLTPMDQWSGLYTTERSALGFTVLSGAGAEDVDFTWQAIGRRKGYEERPTINIPDPEAENTRLEAEARQQKLEEGQKRSARQTSRREESGAVRSEDGRLMELVAE